MISCKKHPAAIVCLAVILTGCASSARFADRTDRGDEKTSASNGRTRDAASRDRVLLSLEGVASYYADEFHGRKTSNGETYDMNALTAAHRTFPFGTRVRVTNLENNKTVIVRVNDRGPFKEGRIMDLSLGAAKVLGVIGTGTARVRLDVLEWGTGQ